MSKSKTSIKRRKTSKQKTFHINHNGVVKTIKALNDRSALHKLYRKSVVIHKKRIDGLKISISSLMKLIKKITPQTEKQKETLENNKNYKKELENRLPMFGEFKICF